MWLATRYGAEREWATVLCSCCCCCELPCCLDISNTVLEQTFWWFFCNCFYILLSRKAHHSIRYSFVSSVYIAKYNNIIAVLLSMAKLASSMKNVAYTSIVKWIYAATIHHTQLYNKLFTNGDWPVRDSKWISFYRIHLAIAHHIFVAWCRVHQFR